MHPPPSLGYIYRPISVLGAGFACGLLLILAMLLATLIGFNRRKPWPLGRFGGQGNPVGDHRRQGVSGNFARQ